MTVEFQPYFLLLNLLHKQFAPQVYDANTAGGQSADGCDISNNYIQHATHNETEVKIGKVKNLLFIQEATGVICVCGVMIGLF